MNDFNDPKYKNVVADIAKVLAGGRVGADISDQLQAAARQAGVDARDAHTVEDRTKIFNNHMIKAAGDQMLNGAQANTFFNAAMSSLNDTTGEEG